MSKWNSVTNNNMGLAYEYLNEPDKAMKAYRVAVTANPEYDLAWYNLALLAARLGNRKLVDEAIEHLQVLNPPRAMAIKSVMLR
jgi:tetratricopeptide (TPR) repeat protein